MRWMLVALTISASVPSFAADDAPLAVLDEPLALKCYTPEERANIVRNDVNQKAQIAELEKNVGVSVPVVITLVVAGLVLGASAGVAVGLSAKK